MATHHWWILWFVSTPLIIAALGLQNRRDAYSCHICRARKDLRTRSVWGVPVQQAESETVPGNPEIAHRHDWWRYSFAYSNGPYGTLGCGAACHTEGRYKDGVY